MKNSKLIKLLMSFDSKELRAFKDYVSSPFFNKNEDLIQFYGYLKKVAPQFSDKKVERKVIFKKIYPKQPYDEKQMNYLMSFLLKLAEEFIGIRNYYSKGRLPAYHILDSLIDRNLDKHYQHTYTKNLQKLNANTIQDSDFYFQQFLMADVAEKYFSKKSFRKFDAHLQEAADFFDIFYLSNKLKYTCKMLNLQKILSVEYHIRLMDEINGFLQKNDFSDIPSIAIYYQLYLSLTLQNGDPHFEATTQLLKKHRHQFTQFEVKEIHLLAINFCIRKIREQDEAYVLKALDLYVEGIQNGLLLENKFLSPWTYKNVIKLGLRSKKYTWTESFIFEYNSKLPEKEQLNALNYNLADLHYYKKDLKKALEYLSKVEFTEVFYTLHSKVMLLKIYYEFDEYDALYALINSFRIYLRRNKFITKDVKETYLNFISILGLFVKNEKHLFLEIQKTIKETKLLTDRNWLLQQCKELKKT